MKTRDLLQMSFRNLWRRKSRTILTILSVVIGATAIITMLSLGIGIKESQMEMINSFVGLNNIQIINRNQKALKKSEVNKIKNINHVKYVIPYKPISPTIYVKNNPNYTIFSEMSVVPDYVLKSISSDMFSEGSNLKLSDKNSMIIGSNVYVSETKKINNYSYTAFPVKDYDVLNSKYKLRLGYKEEDFENKNIQVDDISFKKTYVDIPFNVKGILSKDSFLDPFASYINEKTYEYLLSEDKKIEVPSLEDNKKEETGSSNSIFTNLTIVADDYSNVDYINTKLTEMGYETQSSIDMAEDINQASKKVEIILGGVGSIAFFVSAIGILNTMLMSIYERKKEIGVMKVIGASVSDIRNMFLVESSFIGFFGGIIGLLLSIIISFIINTLARSAIEVEEEFIKISSIPIWLAIIGVTFSVLVGILAGYIPAKRATQLSAIETLRGE